MYNIYNAENGELLAQNLTEDELIDFANEEFAETDNMDDAIENDLLFYDNVYDAQISLEEFGFKVEELWGMKYAKINWILFNIRQYRNDHMACNVNRCRTYDRSYET